MPLGASPGTRSRRIATGILLLAGLGLGACEGGGAPPTCEPTGTQLEIAVLASASHVFTKDCLAAPADTPFTIHFDNQDTSPHGNHSIQIFLPGDDFIGERVFHGDSITYQVPPIPAGRYEFQCEEHPEMNGTFVVR